MIGYRCPKCGEARLDVEITANATLIQTFDRTDGKDDNEMTYDLEPTSIGFDENSLMWCSHCGWQAKASEFSWSSGPQGTLTVIAEQEETEKITWDSA